MGKFNEYSQKATPADNDTLMIYDATAKSNKLSPFSGIWNWIVGKLTNAVISNLQTSNKTVLGAINELNSKTLIITMSGSTDSTGNIRINVPNSFSRMPYVVTNIRDDLQYPYIVIISGWTQNEINFRIRNASDNSAIINTQLPVFQCMLIGK
jgi:hypothetical protein